MEIVSSLNTLDTNCSYQESGDFLEQMPLKLLCLLIKFQIWNTFLFDDFVQFYCCMFFQRGDLSSSLYIHFRKPKLTNSYLYIQRCNVLVSENCIAEQDRHKLQPLWSLPYSRVMQNLGSEYTKVSSCVPNLPISEVTKPTVLKHHEANFIFRGK